jgi:hypothetical protein
MKRERRMGVPAHGRAVPRSSGGLKPADPGRNGSWPTIFPFGLRPNSSRGKIAALRRPPLNAPARSFLAGAGLPRRLLCEPHPEGPTA